MEGLSESRCPSWPYSMRSTSENIAIGINVFVYKPSGVYSTQYRKAREGDQKLLQSLPWRGNIKFLVSGPCQKLRLLVLCRSDRRQSPALYSRLRFAFVLPSPSLFPPHSSVVVVVVPHDVDTSRSRQVAFFCINTALSDQVHALPATRIEASSSLFTTHTIYE
jgi:hypothetical protein